MKIENKYIIGTHIMFFEIDMVKEHIQSINNALDTVDNKENVRVDLFFNISEYFERVNLKQTTHKELIDKFNKLVDSVNCECTSTIYDDNKPVTMVDYRRDLNYFNCKEYDYVTWGESDSLIPKEFFQSLETIKQYANQNNIHKFVTTFALRKMWDESWKVLEHVDMTDKPLHHKHFPGTRKKNPEAYNQPYSIRYTMNIDEMNEINAKTEELDIRVLRKPQFDGSVLVLSGDLLKNGVNVPHCIMGHLVDDTSMMQSCSQIMGESYIQFIVKNILKVHNREHPKKRLYALDMDSDRELSLIGDEPKGNWFFKMKELVHHNLANFGSSQARFNTYNDFEKVMEIK